MRSRGRHARRRTVGRYRGAHVSAAQRHRHQVALSASCLVTVVGAGAVAAAGGPALSYHPPAGPAPSARAEVEFRAAASIDLSAPPPEDSVPQSSREVTRVASRSAVRRPSPAASPAAPRWVAPADGPLTSPFGWRWGRMHEGIDIGAPYGAPIRAAGDGVVIFTGHKGGYGTYIQIRHADGTVTGYGHMSAFVVRSGRVRAGDVIARVGAEGDSTGPHLHFEVWIDGRATDPLPYLRRRGIRY